MFPGGERGRGMEGAGKGEGVGGCSWGRGKERWRGKRWDCLQSPEGMDAPAKMCLLLTRNALKCNNLSIFCS